MGTFLLGWIGIHKNEKNREVGGYFFLEGGELGFVELVDGGGGEF